jgi:nidogen (entactin)
MKFLRNLRDITDLISSKLYWSDWNRDSPKIEWANLDGTERQILAAAPKVQLPNSLDISLQTGELCFADAGTHKIECIDAYTKQVHTIASDLSYPFGLAVSTDRFFWTDWTT